MFDNDFFERYLVLKGIHKPSVRVKVTRLMTILVTESNNRKNPVGNLELQALAGLNRNQFYYLVDGGLSGVWSHIFHASLLFTRQLTDEQRQFILGAASTLDGIRDLSFPDAISLTLYKDYPIRQKVWPSGYITQNGTQFFRCDALTATTFPWRPSDAQFFARDWEVALPDRIFKDS
ncbi:hypothetical protein UXN85_20870 [Enterobacter hormaechei]